MMKKDFQRQVHTWIRKNVKKTWYIRRRKEKGKGTEKSSSKIIALGHIRGDSWYKLHL